MKRGRWHNHDTASWALPEGWRYCPREGAIYHPVKGGWRWREPDHGVADPGLENSRKRVLTGRTPSG